MNRCMKLLFAVMLISMLVMASRPWVRPCCVGNGRLDRVESVTSSIQKRLGRIEENTIITDIQKTHERLQERHYGRNGTLLSK